MDCPCGNNKTYNECCEIAHLSLKAVKTAEQLMRSRYTAFTMANGDYLMESHHITTRPVNEKKEIVAWAKAVEWVKLEIKATTKGLEVDSEGIVRFKAHFKENGKQRFIKESSKFTKENGVWYYLGLA
jgi:SEC-C motif-containing protein